MCCGGLQFSITKSGYSVCYFRQCDRFATNEYSFFFFQCNVLFYPVGCGVFFKLGHRFISTYFCLNSFLQLFTGRLITFTNTFHQTLINNLLGIYFRTKNCRSYFCYLFSLLSQRTVVSRNHCGRSSNTNNIAGSSRFYSAN